MECVWVTYKHRFSHWSRWRSALTPSVFCRIAHRLCGLRILRFSLWRVAVWNTSAVSQDNMWSFSSWKYQWIFSANDLTAVDGEYCLVHNTWEFSLCLLWRLNYLLNWGLTSFVFHWTESYCLVCHQVLTCLGVSSLKALSLWFLHDWGGFISQVYIC